MHPHAPQKGLFSESHMPTYLKARKDALFDVGGESRETVSVHSSVHPPATA